MKNITHPLLLTAISLAALLQACATPPSIQQTSLSVPEAFRTWPANATALAPAGNPWWKAFEDPELDKLIATALENNRDLSQAVARIEQARARVADATGALSPQAGLSVNATRADAGRDYLPQNSPSAGLQLGYEVDLFGRLRTTKDEKNASLRASIEDAEALKATLSADVTLAYLQLRYADFRLLIYTDRYIALRDLLAIAQVRLEAGVANVSGLARTQADLDQVISDRAAAEQERAIAEARIATLTATPDLRIASTPAVRLLSAPFADTPASVLRRRPDVRAAEARLAAANARAFEAYAARFPGLALSTAAGFASSDFHTLLERASVSWALSAVLNATIFDGGQRRAQQTAATAEAQEAAAATDAVLLRAMEEVETALSAYEVEDRALAAVKDALVQTQHLEKLANVQRAAGSVGRQTVLEARLASQSAELNRLTHEHARQQAVVNVARALAL